MKQNEIRGRVKKTKGRVRQAVGVLSGDKKMEQEGALERVEGTIQEGIGQARRKVGEVLTEIGKAVKG